MAGGLLYTDPWGPGLLILASGELGSNGLIVDDSLGRPEFGRGLSGVILSRPIKALLLLSSLDLEDAARESRPDMISLAAIGFHKDSSRN
ncbi:hypothetical protein RRF57_011649 [Xylaria bambusicola]|uniref:Uncharacterized protein n=1 Tax=Xylaria bambusicola TaxID=326684 RepID=A0AAN7UU25_9PEZI